MFCKNCGKGISGAGETRCDSCGHDNKPFAYSGEIDHIFRKMQENGTHKMVFTEAPKVKDSFAERRDKSPVGFVTTDVELDEEDMFRDIDEELIPEKSVVETRQLKMPVQPEPPEDETDENDDQSLLGFLDGVKNPTALVGVSAAVFVLALALLVIPKRPSVKDKADGREVTVAVVTSIETGTYTAAEISDEMAETVEAPEETSTAATGKGPDNNITKPESAEPESQK